MTEEKTETAEPDPSNMEFRMMGGTGLQVSLLSFGFWATFGMKEGIDRCVSVMRLCRNYGVNLFDNAEAYGKNNGDAEIIMGQALKILQDEDPVKWRRTDIVMTTKIFWGPGGGINEKGLSRKHVIEGVNASLERLQLDYVDVVFCHRADALTPIEETVRAFTHVVRSGKALYWGTSEWTSQQITEAYWIARVHNLIPPCVEQPQYNMFERNRVEEEYQCVYRPPYSMGTTIWSPLASGILTGKYNREIPEGSRLAESSYKFLLDRWGAKKAEQLPKIERLMEIGREDLNCSVATLAIAWCMKNPNVSTVLLGATKEHQLIENMLALDVARRITPEIMAKIEEVLGNKPASAGAFGRVLESTI